MRHSFTPTPQFYLTSPQPCPYLQGRSERKLFTSLHGSDAQVLNDALSKQGFRRSQNVLYRPACAQCNACLSARIRVADFVPSKNHRRVLRRNQDLTRRAIPPWASEEQFDLFQTYLSARHSDGGMADMDVFEFAAMVEETPVRTRVIEYKTADQGADDAPMAVALTDVFDDGVSMVYSFFDPAQTRRSLGIHLILDHIELARDIGLPYVYLGYWVQGSPKMDYKARFSSVELYHNGGWTPYQADRDYDTEIEHPLSVDPIKDQLAKIDLPDLV